MVCLDNLDIWMPDASDQQHLLAFVVTSPRTAYMNFCGEAKPPTTTGGEGSYEVTVDTHQHNETFVSNYNMELNKYDFETGKPLENAEFEILEKMDTSQFNDSVDHNGGNADGEFSLVI